MKKRPFHDPDGPSGGRRVASHDTVLDLAAVAGLFEARRQLEAQIVQALSRVDARGDGEVAVGMPIDQHLRWTTNLHGATIAGIGNLLDVWNDLPEVRARVGAAEVNLDQAVAVARGLARVGRDLRAEVDAALADEPTWTRWSPDVIAANVAELLDELQPDKAVEGEGREAEQQWLVMQPHLDGQGLRYWGESHGVDAATFEAAINKASDAPKAGVRRARQQAEGLHRILRDWATGRHHEPDDDQPDADGEPASRPPVMIHLLVEEDHASDGHAATVMTRTRGLAPRLTRDAFERLTDANPDVTTITTWTRDGLPVSIKGRAGHAIDDPDGLSEDSVRELVRLRQGNVCGAPGCTNPVTDFHHVIWQAKDGSDAPHNRAGLCPACHHRIAHGEHGWTITVRDDAWIAWSRDEPSPPTAPGTSHHLEPPCHLEPLCHLEPPRHRRTLRRAPPGPGQVHLDDDSDPIPF